MRDYNKMHLILLLLICLLLTMERILTTPTFLLNEFGF